MTHTPGTEAEWTELDDMATFARLIKKLLDLSDEKAQALEALIVEQFGHGTEDGYCCACEADIAFTEADRQRIEADLKKANDLANTYARIIARVYNGERIEDVDPEEMATLASQLKGEDKT